MLSVPKYHNAMYICYYHLLSGAQLFFTTGSKKFRSSMVLERMIVGSRPRRILGRFRASRSCRTHSSTFAWCSGACNDAQDPTADRVSAGYSNSLFRIPCSVFQILASKILHPHLLVTLSRLTFSNRCLTLSFISISILNTRSWMGLSEFRN